MAFGPGKYDDLATLVREDSKAQGVIVLVWHGIHGTGFSCQGDLTFTLTKIPEMLRFMADEIERSGPDAN